MNINFSSISEIIFELELSWQKNYQLYIAIALSDFRYSIYTNTLKIIKDSFFAKAPLNDITYINDIAKRHQALFTNGSQHSKRIRIFRLYRSFVWDVSKNLTRHSWSQNFRKSRPNKTSEIK